MWLRWAVVIFLTLALSVPIGTALQDAKYSGIKPDAGNPSLFGFIKFVIYIIAIHVWFSSLVLQPIAWWRLAITWILLFGTIGGLYAGYLRKNGKLPLLVELLLDWIGIGIGFWIITTFVLP